MVDKSKRYVRTYVPLAEVPMLTGRQLDFENIAEMFLTRVRERPDDPLVYFYDDVITYAQVNDRANAVANYLKAKA
jgi:long-chain acyl-CoA synthetase